MYTLKVQTPNGIHYFDDVKMISSGNFIEFEKIKSSDFMPKSWDAEITEIIPSNYCFERKKTIKPSFNFYSFEEKPTKTIIFYQSNPLFSQKKVTVVSFSGRAFLEKDGQTINKI